MVTLLCESSGHPQDTDDEIPESSLSFPLLTSLAGSSRVKRNSHCSSCTDKKYLDPKTQRIVVKCKRGHPDCFLPALGGTGRCESVRDSQGFVIFCRCKCS